MSKITKAILTGGGRATRLRPITTTLNKHLIPLANQPMIFHAIDKVVKAGIKEIFINTNPGEVELQKYVGDGSRWNVKIKFFEQQGGPKGIAHVVKQAEQFIGQDPFLFYLSDNIILTDLNEMINKFEKENYDCLLAFARVPDPQRFGVPVFDEKEKLIDVLEKPADPPNNLAVTGIYIYGPNLFFNAFSKIQPSERGEYEISDIHSYLLKNNYNVGYEEISGWWKDTGKPEALLKANALLLDQLPFDYWQIQGASIDDTAEFSAQVFIGKDSQIGKNVKIIGPVIIGSNCKLDNCVIKPYTTIRDNSVIKRAQIGNSLLLGGCQIDCAIKLENSIIGREAKIVKNSSDDVHNLILGDHSLVEM